MSGQTDQGEVTDTTKMWFGKHEGKAMQDVPADYLHWLWQNGLKHRTRDRLHHYISQNLEALKMECPDKIWT